MYQLDTTMPRSASRHARDVAGRPVDGPSDTTTSLAHASPERGVRLESPDLPMVRVRPQRFLERWNTESFPCVASEAHSESPGSARISTPERLRAQLSAP